MTTEAELHARRAAQLEGDLELSRQRLATAVNALIAVAARPGGGVISAMDLARVAQDALNELGVPWRDAQHVARTATCPHAIKVTFFLDGGVRRTTCQGCGVELPEA